jgi:hypothetical protein
MIESDAYARGISQVSDIGSQAVRDIDGRGRSGQSGCFAFGQSGNRSSMSLYERAEEGCSEITELGSLGWLGCPHWLGYPRGPTGLRPSPSGRDR